MNNAEEKLQPLHGLEAIVGPPPLFFASVSILSRNGSDPPATVTRSYRPRSPREAINVAFNQAYTHSDRDISGRQHAVGETGAQQWSRL